MANDNLSDETQETLMKVAREQLEHLKKGDAKKVVELTEQVARQTSTIKHLTELNYQQQCVIETQKIEVWEAHKKRNASEMAESDALSKLQTARRELTELTDDRADWTRRAEDAEAKLAEVTRLIQNPQGAPGPPRRQRHLNPAGRYDRRGRRGGPRGSRV